MKKHLVKLVLASGSTLILATAAAHHGSSPYDGNLAKTVIGTVTNFQFTNPHVLIYVDVEEDNGEVVNWSGELTSPNRLARAASGTSGNVNWSRDILVPGDVIELSGNPARNGAPSLRLRRVVDSRGIVIAGGDTGAVATTPAARFAPETVTPSGDEGGDLSGVWMRAAAESYANYAFSEELPPMTDWALERYRAAKPTFGENGVTVADTNDPVYQCLPPGTPRIYFHPRPFEIIQTPGRVLISYEYQQLIRAVYTDGRPHRSDLAASWMGDSTGNWEGGTLVVESVNFNENTWIDRRGVPHSDQLRVEERLSLNDDGQLIVDVLVEDPVAFTEPWTGRKIFDRVDWTIEEFVCLDNLSFQDFEQILLDHDE
ncbi:MAG: DUF6152 family protein [Candidatus Rariloculaceae bacterium]